MRPDTEYDVDRMRPEKKYLNVRERCELSGHWISSDIGVVPGLCECWDGMLDVSWGR